MENCVKRRWNIIASIINEVQAKLGLNVQMKMERRQPLLQLVLLNYRPITRYSRQGTKEYLYVDVLDPAGKAYFMRERGFHRDANGEITPKSEAPIDDYLLIASETMDFMQDLAVCSGVAINAGEHPVEHQIIESDAAVEFRYLRRNLELQALLFATREFEVYEKMALSFFHAYCLGKYFIGETMQVNHAEVSRRDWVCITYNTYMLYRNIELADYYYCNQKKPSSDMFFEMNRVCIFEQYIPLTYRFTDIYNPILDTGNLLADNSQIYHNAIAVAPLGAVGGNASAISQEAKMTTSLYTTRHEMSRLFHVSVNKIDSSAIATPTQEKKRTIDLYSPKYFQTVLQTQLLQSSGLASKFCLLPLESKVFLRYREEIWGQENGVGEELEVLAIHSISFNTKYRKKSIAKNKAKYQECEMDFLDALFLEYLTHVYRTVKRSTAFQRKGIKADLSKDFRPGSI